MAASDDVYSTDEDSAIVHLAPTGLLANDASVLASVDSFSGGDFGEGLDLDGSFLYAVNVRGPAVGFVRDANFTADNVAGVSVFATEEILAWQTKPEYGPTSNDINLETVMHSLRWTRAPGPVTVTLQNLVVGEQYKLQLLMREAGFNRGFDVYVEGLKIVDDLNPGIVQGGASSIDHAAVVTYEFVAPDTTLDITLIQPAPFPDNNPILQGFTLEELGPPTTVLPSDLFVSQVNGAFPTGSPVTLASGALVTVNADGSFTYDPNGAFEILAVGQSTTDSFPYTASDDLATDTAMVTITIHGVNDPLVANDDAYSTGEDSALAHLAPAGLLANDVNNVDVPDGVASVGSFSGGDVGEGLDLDGSFLYAVNARGPAVGLVRDANFTADSALGVSVFATEEILAWQTKPEYGPTTNDNNLETVMHSLRWARAPGPVTVTLQNLVAGEQYKLQLLMREAGFDRGFDVYVQGLKIVDDFNPGVVQGGANSSDHAAVVTYEFVAPVATLDITLIQPAPFPDNNPILQGFTLEELGPPAVLPSNLFVSQVNGAFPAGSPVTLASGSLVTVNADGSFTYDPNGAFESLAVDQTATDSFPYTASDGDGGTDTATVTVTITGENDAPTDPVDSDGGANEVAENALTGTEVGITASSTDVDNGAVIKYSLTDNAGGRFKIDEDTGVVTVADGSLLDYETATSHTIKVKATDEHSAMSSEVQFTISVLNEANITGFVFADVDGDGVFDVEDAPLANVEITLIEAGVDEVFGTADDETFLTTTDDDGFYGFEDVAAGKVRIVESGAPADLVDGIDTPDSVIDLDAVNDQFTIDFVRADVNGMNFAEQADGGGLNSGDTATIGYWHNKNGQALIEKLDEDGDLTAWLLDNFGNIFDLGDFDEYGGSVSEFYRMAFFKKKLKGTPKVDAQFMAVAFATFATSSNLSNGGAAEYGFNVTDSGIGTTVINVGEGGDAFGVANGTNMTIMALLLATNSLTGVGADLIYDDGDDDLIDTEKSLRVMANVIYTAINEEGDI
ncbi:MAG: cadherin domain-containing protein [Planctomycetes bacterium]|nr:cadherin domain-containing protein [Planctomycetota bacterium]